MNKKIIIALALIIIVLSIGALAGPYLAGKENGGKSTFSDFLNKDDEKEIEEKQKYNLNKIIEKESFLLKYPDGWEETGAPPGASLMLVNKQEEIVDPQAKKLNFQTYISVSYETLGNVGKERFVEYYKGEIKKVFSDAIFGNEKEINVGENKGYVFEMKREQKGINFKVLAFLVYGKGQDVWILSCNTIEQGFAEYENLFYQVADTFKIK